MKFLVILVILFCSTPATAREWWIARHHKDANLVYIVLDGKDEDTQGFEKFSIAVENIPKGKKLAGVNISTLIDWEATSLQQEIVQYYQKNHLQNFINGLKEVGHIKRPSTKQLAMSFGEALKQTTIVKQFDAMLYNYGYRITGVTFEKFNLTKLNLAPHFQAQSNWILVY